jgi:hypothetical protein
VIVVWEELKVAMEGCPWVSDLDKVGLGFRV